MTRADILIRIAACTLVGSLGGTLAGYLVPGSPFEGALPGAITGAGFGLTLGRRAFDAGSGVLWGAAYAFLLWLVMLAAEIAGRPSFGEPAFDFARAAFPQLVADVVVLGLPMGLVLAVAEAVRSKALRPPLSLPRAFVGGGVAGVAGGWAFGKWMERIHYFPLVAGLVHSTSARVGVALHFTIAIAIGATFGLLFQREIRGLGSSMAYGAAYGLLWWFVGPLTILPALTHHTIDWTAAHASTVFGSLVGHVIYGLIVGLIYGAVDRVWQRLFYESDPLHREPAGSINTVASLYWGILGSIAGGGIFSIEMLAAGSLPRVAGLAHGTSAWLGFFVHITISAIIGATYGFFFRYEAPDVFASLAWGLVYGAIWWFLGPLTLFPVLLGQAFTWTSADAGAQLPSLVGHLLYGAATALVFVSFERRHGAWLAQDVRLAAREMRRRRPLRTSAPAVWLLFVGLGITLPILLS